MSSPSRLPLTSQDITAERLAALRDLFPEACCEDKIDFDRLKQALGCAVDTERERYGLTWAGKSEAVRAIQSLSVGTLKPAPEESVHFDTTENLILEGDNLEILKLLQKSYHGKVKMITIDPPYNTGNEFIYPDNFREGLQDYLRYSGQVSEEGFRVSTNSETDGRFHSKWLNMMYPRLFLARNLLRDDGVLFVSIDDHEVHNLRLLMNEIFGEENFMGVLIWKRRQNVDSRAKTGLSIDHEYLIVYGRNEANRLRGQEKDLTKYSNPDNDPRGSWLSGDLTGLATKEQRPNLHYDLVNPETGDIYPCAETGWRYGKPTMARLIEDNRIIWPPKPSGRPRVRRYQNELADEFTGLSSVLNTIYTTQGTKELKELFDGKDVMDFPKPSEYIKIAVQQATCANDGDIVLDFFAGSGTTAQAVLELNKADGGNRKFILVQLPEKTDNPQFPTIAEITKERVRRVIKKLTTEDTGVHRGKITTQSLPTIFSGVEEEAEDIDPLCSPVSSVVKPSPGFKVLKLCASNFKIWDGEQEATVADALAGQLAAFADNLQPDSAPLDVLFEILLKAGYDLNARREKQTIAGQTVYVIDDGALVVCLEPDITSETLRGMAALKPQSVICLDTAFHGNDALLTNAELEMQANGIQFQTV